MRALIALLFAALPAVAIAQAPPPRPPAGRDRGDRGDRDRGDRGDRDRGDRGDRGDRDRGDRDRGDRDRRGGGSRAEAEERLRMMRMWKITEALNLDDATAQKLFPLLHRYDDRLGVVHKDMGDLVARLRVESEAAKPDAAAITKLIDQLVADREKVHQIEAERVKEVRRVLTPVQQAKLVMALPRIEDRLRRLIWKAQRHGAEDE